MSDLEGLRRGLKCKAELVRRSRNDWGHNGSREQCCENHKVVWEQMAATGRGERHILGKSEETIRKT